MGSPAIQIVDANGTVKMLTPRRSPEMDLKDGKVYRAIYSNRQLEEVLVDFWFNHFNVTNVEGHFPSFADYEREAIRPHVLPEDSRTCCLRRHFIRQCCCISTIRNRSLPHFAQAQP